VELIKRNISLIKVLKEGLESWVQNFTLTPNLSSPELERLTLPESIEGCLDIDLKKCR